MHTHPASHPRQHTLQGAMRVALLAAFVAAALLASAAPSAHASVSRWRPQIGDTFFWQLSGRPTHQASASVYDVDGFDRSAAFVRQAHARKRHVVCYISGGSHEDWRPDAKSFPSSVIGKPLDGWPGERWLDIRRIDLIGPILERRVTMCARKGFDAVEYDNVDGFSNDTGFALTAADQLRFNRWIANAAHRRGLAAGLKNDPEQVSQLVRWFDFAVVEECFTYHECSSYSPFIRARKPVFVAQYGTPLATFCPYAARLHFNAARYPLLLDGRRWPCRKPRS